MTGHGFRSMASTLLNEQGWHPDLIELQLAHAERNKVRAANNRAQRLDERRKIMQAWADYLMACARAGANVVPIKHGRDLLLDDAERYETSCAVLRLTRRFCPTTCSL